MMSNNGASPRYSLGYELTVLRESHLKKLGKFIEFLIVY